MKALLNKIAKMFSVKTKGIMTMKKKFKPDDQIVLSIVTLILTVPGYTLDRVPKLFNLREVVEQVLFESQGKKEEVEPKEEKPTAEEGE